MENIIIEKEIAKETIKVDDFNDTIANYLIKNGFTKKVEDITNNVRYENDDLCLTISPYRLFGYCISVGKCLFGDKDLSGIDDLENDLHKGCEFVKEFVKFVKGE